MSIGNLVPKRGTQAFTLLELIVVIVILGILAALAIPTFARVIATSELEVAEVTAASVVRETLALSAFNQEGLITEDSITTAAADLPGRVAYSSGTYAAETVPYRVVFGKWEFSGNDRTLSAVRSGTPVGSSVGVALYVPEIGCAFAKSEGNNVSAWSVMGLDPTSCNGAGAFLSPEELLELSAPPVPDGLEVTFGCSVPGGGTGWNITFDSGMVDVFINGVYLGQYSSGACVPGKATDKVTVVPSNGSTPGWEGGIGDVFDDGSSELPGEPEAPPALEVSAPVLSDGSIPILVEWTPPTDGTSDGIIVSRQPAADSGSGGGSGSWSPVYAGGSGGSGGGMNGGYIYDSAPSGNWSYQVQPTLNGQPAGDPVPVTAGQVANPAPVTSDGGAGSKPAAVLIGDSALIAWGAVADTKNAPLTGYHVYRSVNGEAYTLQDSTLKNETSFTSGPLLPGTYCYALTSYGIGGQSGLSAAACVTVARPSWDAGTTPSSSKLSIPGVKGGDWNGSAVSIDGDTMVVGASSTYVFTRNGSTWTQQAILTNPRGVSADLFGYPASISGDTIVIGAQGDATNGAQAGAAHVFTRNGTTWSHQARISASNGSSGDYFGANVAVEGDTIMVGAGWADSLKGADTGAVYVFTRNGNAWTETSQLIASDSASGEGFGAPLTLQGDTLVVGARWAGSPTQGVYSGAAYVFTRNGNAWNETAKLTANDGKASDAFGTSLSLDGDTIVVGAPYADTTRGKDAGAAYVFTKEGSSWTGPLKLTVADGSLNDYFGTAASVSADTIAVSANGKDNYGLLNTGQVYIYTREGGVWKYQTQIRATTLSANMNFGSSVTFSGSTLAVAALSGDGGVHLFQP